MLLGIDPNGGRLAVEDLKNLWQLLLAVRLRNGRTRGDARMSEERQEKDPPGSRRDPAGRVAGIAAGGGRGRNVRSQRGGRE
jgi:hypothetical protein